MLYFGIATSLFLLRYLVANAARVRQKVYFAVLLGLFLFSAFRYQVGCDWFGYYSQYLRAQHIDLSFILRNREPIWWAILIWMNDVDLPYPALNIVSSAVFFIGVHVLARRQPDPLAFLVLLFPVLIINMPMSGIRQGAAIGFLCIAFAAFIDRRPFWFSLWVGLAAGFHSSALAFFLLLPLTTGRYSRRRLLLAGMLAIPGSALLISEGTADVAIERYIGTDREAFGAIFRVGALGISALYFFLFARRKWMVQYSHDFSLVIVGSIGMVLAIFILPASSIIGDRFGYYLIPIQSMIFSRLPFLSFRSSTRLHSVLPYIGLTLLLFVWTQISSHFHWCYVPYSNWIFDLPRGIPLQ